MTVWLEAVVEWSAPRSAAHAIGTAVERTYACNLRTIFRPRCGGACRVCWLATMRFRSMCHPCMTNADAPKPKPLKQYPRCVVASIDLGLHLLELILTEQ